MTELANLQFNIAAQFVADKSYLEELINQSSATSQTLLLSLQKEAESLMTTARNNHATLINAKKPSETVTKYINEDVYTQIRRNFHVYWAQIENTIVKERPETTLNSTTFNETQVGQRQFKVKLKPLTLPTFAGDIRTWKSFYNSFVSLVEDNTNISTLDKLRYLLDSLTHDAKSLVTHLPVEEQNYEIALKLLTERYDHKRILVNVQLNTIYNLEVMKKESATNIRKTIDLVRECYQSLKCLGIQVDDWSPVIIFLVQNKLPQHVNQLWEEKLNNTKELPTFKQFEDFLECRFRTLDILTPRAGTSTSNVFYVQPDNDISCSLCQGSHYISSCKQFLDAEPSKRYSLVISNHLCINCLSKRHMLYDCPSKRHCRDCPKRHHTLLHRDQKNFKADSNQNKTSKNKDKGNRNNNRSKKSNKSNSQKSNNSQSTSQIYTTQSQNIQSQQEPSQSIAQVSLNPQAAHFQPPVNQCHHVNSYSRRTYLLGTAVVELINDRGNSRRVRALLDTGSEDNYIIDSVVTGLPLKKYHSPSDISVLGGQLVEGITHRCEFRIRSIHNDFELRIDAGIKGSITPDLPKEPIPGLCYKFLNNLKLADESFDEPGPIHLLLGMGVWVQIIQNGLIKNDSLMALKTSFGWMVQGVTDKPTTQYRSKASRCLSTLGLESQMQKFFELETVGNGKILETPENVLCEQIVLKSIKQLEDGRLSVDLPFKDNLLPVLGKSRNIAKNRFFNLEKRLNQNPSLKEEYHKTIRDYLKQGHLKLIEESDDDREGRHYYIPHHAVFKQSSTTTKVRVVFDASCKTSDTTSLNDHLLTGSKLQIDIRDILLRWRQYPYVLSADIEKMYRQFIINEKFHNYQKILWRFSNSENLKAYVLTTVTFGTSSAPYVALRLLKYIAETQEAITTFPLASKIIHTDFYVDDLMSGAYSINETVRIQKEMRNLLSKFGLSIRKWCSNNLGALESIPPEFCEITEQSFDETDYKKTLGVYWSPSLDSFAFSVEPQDFPNLKLTKRKTLSLIARLYDPLGWLGPLSTYAKIIMQKIWQSQIGWDDLISEDVKAQFTIFLKDLQNLNTLVIPRWIGVQSSTESITLLGFADASEVGFGCVIYLKGSDCQGNILLTSKSRVAPLNFTTIARLELCAALLLAETLEWCEGLFSGRQITLHLFSDSKIVLSWLQAHPSRWKTFVANRTSEILRRYPREHWHYVNTKENPADFISRGLLPSEILSNELWWKGPTCLELDKPFSLESEEEHRALQHESKIAKQCLITQSFDTSLIKHFSSNRKLYKRISSISSFIMKCLLKCCKRYPQKQQRYLELIQSIQNPEHVVLRLVQREHFGKEIQLLTNKLPLAKDSKIRTLSPFLDGFGILRCGSRLDRAETLNYDQKYPIILPSHNQFTTNVINESHGATMHGGFKIMFSYIRNKYHILRGKDRINFYRRRCVNCIRYAKAQQNQLMGSLPFPRINQFKPFLFSGVDFAGPMLIRNKFSKGSKTSKAYIAIFICLCTKAIHIELVSDLTSEAFLAALRRFVYRRGRVQVMHSDNGTNFQGASKTLFNECHEAQSSWKNELQPQLSDLGIEWEFIPPSSPHFGGLWEAGVKSIKSHLNKTLKDAILTFEEYYTVLVQIEGILNSRPLCPLSNDPESYEALTPSHFLVGEALVGPPEPKLQVKPTNSLKRWRYIQALQQQFWLLWKTTYLHSLSKRPKWLDLQRNFEINDLVLLAEDNFAPTIWPLARVIEIHPGKDGLVRVVTIKTAQGKYYKRPIAKLRFLPINTHEDFSQQS